MSVTQPHYADSAVTLWHGDALEVMRQMPAASVDAVVCDPPYGLEFMGREWDTFKPSNARIRTRVDGRTNPAEGKSTTSTPEAYVAGAPFQEFSRAWAVEAYRVLKPGGHLLAFGGSRTWHRLTCGIEDAGFEIRDTITWMYGSGFPKSLDVSKAIDRQRNDRPDVERIRRHLEAARVASGVTRRDVAEAFSVDTRMVQKWMGATDDLQAHCPTWEQWLKLRDLLGLGDEMDAEVWRLNGRKGTPGEAWEQREQVGEGYRVRRESTVQIVGLSEGAYPITAPATDDARRWQGWGTALKPASEPIVVARKPLAGTVAQTVVAYGTGALNIDACRVEGAPPSVPQPSFVVKQSGGVYGFGTGEGRNGEMSSASGRWPANVVLSHGGDACSGPDGCVRGCPVAELDRQSGVTASTARMPTGRDTRGIPNGNTPVTRFADTVERGHNDSGGASRFFPTFRYEAKAPTSERPRVAASPTLRMRADLSEAERSYVLAELAKAGVDVA